MWVFCCGMFRSASTLQFQITSQLVKDYQLGEQIGWIDFKRFSEVRDTYASVSGLKVIKVHLCTDSIAAEFAQNNAIGIYSFRDIRDVYTSFMKQRQKSFDHLWQEGLVDTCLESYKRWTSLPNVLISRYENIVHNLPQEVKRIANHLDLSLSEQQCTAIASNYSIESQQERISQFRQQLLATERNPNDHRDLVDYHDESSLLHMNHIDSGQAGRWHHDLSKSEVELIVDRVKKWCVENDYSPTEFLFYNTPILA